MKKLLLVISMLLLVGCRFTPSEPSHKIDLYPTPTVLSTQTQRVIVQEITSTPAPTQTPNVVVVSATPNPVSLCVVASEAVYLRPSPSEKNYPILPLPKGERLDDLGGRKGNWVFVSYGDKQGWVNGNYIALCK